MRRILMVLAVAALMAAMLVVIAAPAFAQPTKENSCGKVSEIAEHPVGQTAEYNDCGGANNPNYPEKPKGKGFQGDPSAH